MGRQLTVRLPDDLSDALDSAAERMQRKNSEIVRLALREYLGSFDRRMRHADRVRSLVGSLDSGIPDLAENHREQILRALRDGK
jgi:predicted transcriptional regulator